MADKLRLDRIAVIERYAEKINERLEMPPALAQVIRAVSEVEGWTEAMEIIAIDVDNDYTIISVFDKFDQTNLRRVTFPSEILVQNNPTLAFRRWVARGIVVNMFEKCRQLREELYRYQRHESDAVTAHKLAIEADEAANGQSNGYGMNP